MIQKKYLVIALLITVAVVGVSANGGGGGILLQRQMPSWTFSPLLPEPDPDFQSWTFSGYGYGIFASGFMLGGFGQISWDIESNNSYISTVPSQNKAYFDFFGGLILGQSVGDEGLRLNVACKLGVGFLERFLDAGITGNGETGDFFLCGLVDPYVELSVPLVSWMRLSAIVGYQYTRAFAGFGISGSTPQISDAYAAGTPTLGVALTFGR